MRVACPCCHYLTLETSGGFEICQVYYWEDDGQGDHDADVMRGGPNGDISLTEGRNNFARYGASEQRFAKHVRSPRPEEMPLQS